MKTYTDFIGVDIGKFNFVVAKHGQKKTQEYENSVSGFEAFIKDYQDSLSGALCVLETTGGYELGLALTLCHYHYSVHRANTPHVKNFIRSWGNAAKSDALDAKALALYGFERNETLTLFKPSAQKAYELYELTQRRQDLKQMLTAEKNRAQSPQVTRSVKESYQLLIHTLSEQVEMITQQINALIDEDEVLKARKEALKTIPGIGDIVANMLLALMPELGNLNRKQIASLAGVAPRVNDSGTCRGYRAVAPGRSAIRSILFISAMAARNSNFLP